MLHAFSDIVDSLVTPLLSAVPFLSGLSTSGLMSRVAGGTSGEVGADPAPPGASQGPFRGLSQGWFASRNVGARAGLKSERVEDMVEVLWPLMADGGGFVALRDREAEGPHLLLHVACVCRS